jgi:hypothetical protein
MSVSVGEVGSAGEGANRAARKIHAESEPPKLPQFPLPDLHDFISR